MKLPESPFTRNLLYSQIAMYLTFAVCVILAPAGLGDNAGFSYFGHHRITVIPFIAGLTISAYFLFISANYPPRSPNGKFLARSFRIMTPFIMGIALVPAIGDSWIDLFHRIFGTVLFGYELMLASWIVWQAKKIISNWLLLGLQLGGGVVALIYLSPAHGFELQGQLVFQAAFSVLILSNLKNLLGKVSKT